MTEQTKKRSFEETKDVKITKGPVKQARIEMAAKGLAEAMEKLEKKTKIVEESFGEGPAGKHMKAVGLIIVNATKALVQFYHASESGLNSAIFFTNPMNPEQELALSFLRGEHHFLGDKLSEQIDQVVGPSRWQEFVGKIVVRDYAKLGSSRNGRTSVLSGYDPRQKNSIGQEYLINFWPNTSARIGEAVVVLSNIPK